MDQLEIMRHQLAAMKQQLDTQAIINDKLLRRVMRNKASWLNKLVNIEIITLPVVYLVLAAISSRCGISQWYAGIFLIMAAIDTALDTRTIRIPPHMFGTSSILELKKFLLRQKKERFIQTCVMIPLTYIWIFAFLYAIYRRVMPGSPGIAPDYAVIGAFAGGSIGFIISIVVVFLLYRKIQHTSNTLLGDIDDLESGR